MASKVVELGWIESAPSATPHRATGVARNSPRLVAGGRSSIAGHTSLVPEASLRLEHAAPLKGFLRDLHREKRRAERTAAPLSLVLFRIDLKSGSGLRQTAQLVELLHGSKRVTDFLGHVGDDMVAVLCPDTNAAGIKGFMKKVEAQGAGLPFAGVAATYPDDLFDNLTNGTRTSPDLQPFLASDATGGSESGYALKRTLDVVGSLAALCLLGPLMLVIGAMVALTSKGPIIFKQTRVGQGGFPFTFYKFRSMNTNSDDSVHREFVANLISAGEANTKAADGSPVAFKLQFDPRVTPIGRFIRKTSIDELPQLFNVLKGDMSLVGPRPPIPYEATQYQPWHLRRLMSLKPGLTGIWQVEGRSRVPFNDMVRMDLRYIRECSLALDLKILLKTVAVVLRGDGAD